MYKTYTSFIFMIGFMFLSSLLSTWSKHIHCKDAFKQLVLLLQLSQLSQPETPMWLYKMTSFVCGNKDILVCPPKMLSFLEQGY